MTSIRLPLFNCGMTFKKTNTENNYDVPVSWFTVVEVITFNINIFVVLIWTITRPVVPDAFVIVVAMGKIIINSCSFMRIVILTIDS